MKRYLMASAIFLVLITSPCYAGVKAGSISAGFEDGWYGFDPQEDVTNSPRQVSGLAMMRRRISGLKGKPLTAVH